jgi:hypothetical protein
MTFFFPCSLCDVLKCINLGDKLLVAEMYILQVIFWSSFVIYKFHTIFFQFWGNFSVNVWAFKGIFCHVSHFREFFFMFSEM